MLFKPFLREGWFMPLPVAFISTVSREGVRNIAPYSCIMPVLRPLDLICLASAWKRDTLKNIKETKQFVVNLAGENLADKVILTARPEPPEPEPPQVDGFISAGLTVKPSELIAAPGISGAYAWMECSLHKTYEEDNYVLVMGKVLRLEVAEDVLTGDGALDVAKARPLLMTGSNKGMHFCTLAETGKNEPFGAMFPDGKDPLAHKYQ